MEGSAKRLHATSMILSLYDSTCAGRRGATCSRSASICPPEVKQGQVTCHLMDVTASTKHPTLLLIYYWLSVRPTTVSHQEIVLCSSQRFSSRSPAKLE